MKQWKRKLWKTCNGVLATLLAWLGFSCLDENGNEPGLSRTIIWLAIR